MARKGTRTTQKRLSAPRAVRLPRKEKAFSVAARPGPHSKEESVPLGVVARDLLGITGNARETRIALNAGQLSVDGITRKDRHFAVGLFDVIKVKATGKAHRAVYDSKGRIAFREIPERESGFKLCRVKSKILSKGGKVQLAATDGSTFFAEGKEKIAVGDTLKVKLPERKVAGHYALAKGSLIYITGGKHVSETASVKEVFPGTLQRGGLLTLESGGKQFQTTAENAFVIGERKAEISLGRENAKGEEE